MEDHGFGCASTWLPFTKVLPLTIFPGGQNRRVTQPFRIFILILTAVWLPGNVIKRRVRRPASFWRGPKT